MSWRWPFALWAVATGLVGCGGDVELRSQWRVTIATDAPIPQFGDRLLVEILPADGEPCSGCRRVLPAEGFPLSFGIRPSAEPPRLRVRLFRAARTGTDGTPNTTAAIDVLGSLPPLSDGISDVRVSLEMDCFGVPADPALDRTCEPSTGELAQSLVFSPSDGALPTSGSWEGARPVDCPAAAPAKMRCIPGGAFLLGGSAPLLAQEGTEPSPERLVRISPFALDEVEVTVEMLDALLPQLTTLPGAFVDDPNKPLGYCTYLGPDPKAPLNCVSRDLAEQICTARGLRLPTEAEWEWAAGGRELELPFAWGSDGDLCAMAVLGRAPYPSETSLTAMLGDASCRFQDGNLLLARPAAGGNPKDVTRDGVRDMTGNLSEWVYDGFAAYDDPCWHPGQAVLEDPSCPLSASAPASYRGGSWLERKSQARVVQRWRLLQGTAFGPQHGVRCAKSFD